MPNIGKQVDSLRLTMNLTQTDLSKHFGVSAMSVSRWERNVNSPTASELIKLGLLAKDAGLDGWPFWNLAGITRTDARKALKVAG